MFSLLSLVRNDIPEKEEGGGEKLLKSTQQTVWT